MSEFDLTVGKSYAKRRNDLCLAHLHNLGLVSKGFFGGFKGENGKWTVSDQETVTISLLNLATVCVFMDHVAKLMGQPAELLMNHEILGNLPWWMDSLWVPVKFPQHHAFEQDADGPFFLGSVPGLLAALAEVKGKSEIPLDRRPLSYDAMRKDYRGCAKDFQGLKDDEECIQWVWNGLFEAATLAEKERLPIRGNGL